MSLQINDSTSGMLRALHQTRERLQRTTTRLATGKRIASASDDAAGLAISRRLEAEVRGLSQGERNLADGASYASTAEGALQSSHDTLGRMRELAIQAQNGTLSDSDRETIQQEYDQLAESLDQTAGSTNFAGQQQLDGTASGPGAPQFTDGNGDAISVDIGDMSASGLGVSGLSAADPATLDAIDNATQQVSSTRSSLGAAQNAMASRSETIRTMRDNAEAARSRIEDADYARELAELTRDRILQGLQVSGIKITGRANHATLDLLS